MYIINVKHKKVRPGLPFPDKADTRPVIKDPRFCLLIIYNWYCCQVRVTSLEELSVAEFSVETFHKSH